MFMHFYPASPSFKQRLQAAIDSLGWTTDETANYLRVGRFTVNRWLDGRSEPYRMMAALVINALEERAWYDYEVNLNRG
jgi:DNA-binding transcriptional regulator YiaG